MYEWKLGLLLAFSWLWSLFPICFTASALIHDIFVRVVLQEIWRKGRDALHLDNVSLSQLSTFKHSSLAFAHHFPIQ